MAERNTYRDIMRGAAAIARGGAKNAAKKGPGKMYRGKIGSVYKAAKASRAASKRRDNISSLLEDIKKNEPRKSGRNKTRTKRKK